MHRSQLFLVFCAIFIILSTIGNTSGALPVSEVNGRSCSSKDGNKDCYCNGGCWRTQTDCACTAAAVFEDLESPPKS